MIKLKAGQILEAEDGSKIEVEKGDCLEENYFEFSPDTLNDMVGSYIDYVQLSKSPATGRLSIIIEKTKFSYQHNSIRFEDSRERNMLSIHEKEIDWAGTKIKGSLVEVPLKEMGLILKFSIPKKISVK